jgi:hypothetical protein
VKCKKGLHGVKEVRNILQTIKIRNANKIGHIFRRNYLQKHISEGKIDERIEGMRRRERRSKQLLNDLEKRR